METNHHGNQRQQAVEDSIPRSIDLCQHGIFRHQIFFTHHDNCVQCKTVSLWKLITMETIVNKLLKILFHDQSICVNLKSLGIRYSLLIMIIVFNVNLEISCYGNRHLLAVEDSASP